MKQFKDLYGLYFDDSEFAHVGRSKRDGAKVGSGRYPLGSGKNPNQYEKTSLDKIIRKISGVDKDYNVIRRMPVVGMTKTKAKKVLPKQTYELFEKIVDSNNNYYDGAVMKVNTGTDKYYKNGKYKRTTMVLTRPYFEISRQHDGYTKQEQKIIDLINQSSNFKIKGMLNEKRYGRLESIAATNDKDQILDVVFIDANGMDSYY